MPSFLVIHKAESVHILLLNYTCKSTAEDANMIHVIDLYWSSTCHGDCSVKLPSSSKDHNFPLQVGQTLLTRTLQAARHFSTGLSVGPATNPALLTQLRCPSAGKPDFFCKAGLNLIQSRLTDSITRQWDFFNLQPIYL